MPTLPGMPHSLTVGCTEGKARPLVGLLIDERQRQQLRGYVFLMAALGADARRTDPAARMQMLGQRGRHD